MILDLWYLSVNWRDTSGCGRGQLAPLGGQVVEQPDHWHHHHNHHNGIQKEKLAIVMTRNEFAQSTPPTSNHDQIMNMDGRGRPTCHPSYRRTSACSAPATWRPTNICLWKVFFFCFSSLSCSITPFLGSNDLGNSLGLILSTSPLYSLCWLNSIHDIFEAVWFQSSSFHQVM